MELKALKEEFQHHQDKVDEYYALVREAAQKQQDDHSKSALTCVCGSLSLSLYILLIHLVTMFSLIHLLYFSDEMGNHINKFDLLQDIEASDKSQSHPANAIK